MLRQREHDDGGGHVVFSEGDKHAIRCVSGRVIVGRESGQGRDNETEQQQGNE